MSTNSDGTDPKTNTANPAAGEQPDLTEANDAQAATEPRSEGQRAARQPTSASDEASEPQTPEQLIIELEGQKADLVDRLLRAHAEMDNLRKRMEREKAELAKFAISKFAIDMVGVGDNFERAISAVPQDDAENNPTLKSLLDGVNMTERAFLQALDRHGVKRIFPTGEQFDPNFHQAVMEQQDPSVPNGSILKVFQAGYVIEERVLRPAMVVVARGGAKNATTDKNAATEQPPAAANDADSETGSPSASDDSPDR